MDINDTLIEAAIQDLLQVRAALEAERTRLSNRIGDLDREIALWREKLAVSSAGAPEPGAIEKKRRRTRAECEHAVEAVFNSPFAWSGLSVRQVAEAAGLPWSTARDVLCRLQNLQQCNGLWQRKRPGFGTKKVLLHG